MAEFRYVSTGRVGRSSWLQLLYIQRSSALDEARDDHALYITHARADAHHAGQPWSDAAFRSGANKQNLTQVGHVAGPNPCHDRLECFPLYLFYSSGVDDVRNLQQKQGVALDSLSSEGLMLYPPFKFKAGHPGHIRWWLKGLQSSANLAVCECRYNCPWGAEIYFYPVVLLSKN